MGGEGFFSENFQSLLKSQKQIEEVVELLNRDQDFMKQVYSKQKAQINSFLYELR